MGGHWMMLDEVGCPGVRVDGIECPPGAIGCLWMELGATVGPWGALWCDWLEL